MSKLGDLLELLYRAESAWRTIRLTAEEWTHVQRQQQAFERRYAAQQGEGGHALSLYGADAYDAPKETTTEIRVWATADGRRRLEREGSHGSYTFVFDGSRSWSYTPEFGAIVHEGRTLEDQNEYHLDSRSLIDAYVLSVEGTVQVAGRPALSVRGRPRGAGVDEVALAIDAERGIVLSSDSFLDGEPVRRFVVTDIAYDEDLAETTFAYEPPPGEHVRTQEEAFRTDYVTLDEASKRASFTVWRPQNLGPDWKVVGLHRPESERPVLHESVHLLFHDDALHSFTIEQAATALLAWRTEKPELVVRDGIELRVFHGQRPGPPAEVQVEREGTHLRLSSDSLPADSLLDLAATLAPASTEPPPLFAK